MMNSSISPQNQPIASTTPQRRSLRIIGLSDDEGEDNNEFRSAPRTKKKRKIVTAELEQLLASLGKHASAETALLQLFQEDSSLSTSLFTILQNQKAPPLFHVAQVGSLELVMMVYSLNPKAILYQTKSGYTAHHFAAVAKNDDVLRFLVLQNPKALAQAPSILGMLMERIDALPLLDFCLSQYPPGLYENDGNTLLHKACAVTSFPYLGPRPQAIRYLLQKWPHAASIPNHQDQLPLHLLLQHSTLLGHVTICTESALLLLQAYPASLEIPNAAGLTPLELCLEAGASLDLLLVLNPHQECVLPSHHPSVIAAHLVQTCPKQHLVQTKVWDELALPLTRAVSLLLRRRSPEFTQLTVAYTRMEVSGLCIIIQALEFNKTVQHAMLAANVGYYASKVGGPVAELPDHPEICVAVGNYSQHDLSRALQRLFCFNTSLVALDLSQNVLPVDPTWLFPLMSNKTLRWLNLAGTNLNGRLLSALIPVLRHNTTLQELHLPLLDERHVLDLLPTLRETRTLQKLVLPKSTEATLKLARQILKDNPHLQQIELGPHKLQQEQSSSTATTNLDKKQPMKPTATTNATTTVTKNKTTNVSGSREPPSSDGPTKDKQSEQPKPSTDDVLSHTLMNDFVMKELLPQSSSLSTVYQALRQHTTIWADTTTTATIVKQSTKKIQNKNKKMKPIKLNH